MDTSREADRIVELVLFRSRPEAGLLLWRQQPDDVEGPADDDESAAAAVSRARRLWARTATQSMHRHPATFTLPLHLSGHADGHFVNGAFDIMVWPRHGKHDETNEYILSLNVEGIVGVSASSRSNSADRAMALDG